MGYGFLQPLHPSMHSDNGAPPGASAWHLSTNHSSFFLGFFLSLITILHTFQEGSWLLEHLPCSICTKGKTPALAYLHWRQHAGEHCWLFNMAMVTFKGHSFFSSIQSHDVYISTWVGIVGMGRWWFWHKGNRLLFKCNRNWLSVQVKQVVVIQMCDLAVHCLCFESSTVSIEVLQDLPLVCRTFFDSKLKYNTLELSNILPH